MGGGGPKTRWLIHCISREPPIWEMVWRPRQSCKLSDRQDLLGRMEEILSDLIPLRYSCFHRCRGDGEICNFVPRGVNLLLLFINKVWKHHQVILAFKTTSIWKTIPLPSSRLYLGFNYAFWPSLAWLLLPTHTCTIYKKYMIRPTLSKAFSNFMCLSTFENLAPGISS